MIKDQDILLLMEARERAQNALRGVLTDETRERLNNIIKTIDGAILRKDAETIEELLRVRGETI